MGARGEHFCKVQEQYGRAFSGNHVDHEGLVGHGRIRLAEHPANPDDAENQFVVHATVHQRPGDTACLKPHVESFKESFGHVPGTFAADAGYGSEENYDYLEGEGAEASVKYNTFHEEQKRPFSEDPTQPANWAYDEEPDEYKCGGGRSLAFVRERREASDLGYVSTVRIYSCGDCSGCGLSARCLRRGQEKGLST